MADPVEAFVVSGPRGMEQPPIQIRESRAPIIASGSALFKKIIAAESGNVVMSPVSVLFALGMTAAGTSDGSKSQDELKRYLRYPELGSNDDEVHETFSNILAGLRGADPKVVLTVANSIWVEGSVHDEFKAVCGGPFDSEVRPLGSASAVNEWVSGATKGLIPSVLSADPPGPAAIVNAVYFKAAWASAFKREDSEKAPFRSFDGAEAECVLMKRSDKRTLFAETDEAQVVFLPYGAGRFTAAVILPSAEGRQGLEAAAEVVDRLAELAESAGRTHVITYLPRFKLEYGPLSLKPALAALGVTEPFRPSGGFLRMSSDPTVYVDDVLHKVRWGARE